MTTDEYYTHAFSRLMRGWANLGAFREVSDIGIPASSSTMRKKSQRIVASLVSRPDWNTFLKTPDALERLGGLQAMESMMTENALGSARRSVDAASIVFAHSVADAAASDFLRVTSMVSPEDWEQFLDERKGWRVADVRAVRYETLFAGLLLEELDGIERNWSLPKKIGRLQQLCRPQSDWLLPMRYDQAEMARIDELRHDIIHGDSLAEPLPSVESDLQFLRGVGEYCFVLVNKRYNIRLVFYD